MNDPKSEESCRNNLFCNLQNKLQKHLLFTSGIFFNTRSGGEARPPNIILCSMVMRILSGGALFYSSSQIFVLV